MRASLRGLRNSYTMKDSSSTMIRYLEIFDNIANEGRRGKEMTELKSTRWKRQEMGVKGYFA